MKLTDLNLDPRTLAVPAALAAAVLVAAWLTVGPAVQHYRDARAQRAVLTSAALANQPIETRIAELRNEVADVHRRLEGHDGALAPEALEAHVIGALQELSSAHDIDLSGIEPEGTQQLGDVERRLFKVSMIASFENLVGWFADLERRLGFAMVESFKLTAGRASGADDELRVQLTIAVYRGPQP